MAKVNKQKQSNKSSKASKKKDKAKKKSLKGITSGSAHIKSTFNNTVITITDKQGNVIVWSTPGVVGFNGSKKSTPFAPQLAGSDAARKAKELGLKVGRPHTIQEGRVGWWSGYGSRWGARRGGAMAQNVIQNAPSSAGTESSVALGQIKVYANVTVRFELE